MYIKNRHFWWLGSFYLDKFAKIGSCGGFGKDHRNMRITSRSIFIPIFANWSSCSSVLLNHQIHLVPQHIWGTSQNYLVLWFSITRTWVHGVKDWYFKRNLTVFLVCPGLSMPPFPCTGRSAQFTPFLL